MGCRLFELRNWGLDMIDCMSAQMEVKLKMNIGLAQKESH